MKCTKHPKYQVLRKPSSDCPMCWHIWAMKHRGEKRRRLDTGRWVAVTLLPVLLLTLAGGCATLTEERYDGRTSFVHEYPVPGSDAPAYGGVGISSGARFGSSGNWFDGPVDKRRVYANASDKPEDHWAECQDGGELKFNVKPHHKVWFPLKATRNYKWTDWCHDVEITR